MKYAFVCLLSFSFASAVHAADPTDDYAAKIKPTLANRCLACHGALKQEAGLRLDTAQLMAKGGDSGPAILAGKPAESLLHERVTAADEGFRMPPEGKPLTAEEVTALKQWIQEGAKAPADEQPQQDPRTYWSFVPPRRPAVPKVSDATWARHPIDAFLAVEHAKRGLIPRPAADKATLLRRVTLDLIGVPPTRDELRAFLADTSNDAYEKVVDRLLANPQYGERWGRHWMDIWRYSDWYGSRGINEIRYSQRHIWRWRDWIVESLNADKGYDRMIVEMLAGDEVAPADPDIARATGFLGRNWYKFDRNVWMFETVEQTSQAFLAVTMKCCRCHDHKFDPIAQKDYYRFRAFFEPHAARTDQAPGELDVMKDGVPRVFDEKLDAPTFLFARGDDRYPEKDHPLAPGVPAALGGSDLKIEPVSLPVESYYPALRPMVVNEMMSQATTAVANAQGETEKARQIAAAARTKVERLLASASDGNAPASASMPPVFMDDFSKERPELWTTIRGQWEYKDGRLHERISDHFATMLSLVEHPRDFQARVRYKTTDGGLFRSVGVSFDASNERHAQCVYTSVNDTQPSVQAFHRKDGREEYPAAGIVPTPLAVNQEITLDLAVRDSLLNVWVNGELKIAYRLPVARQAGRFALWVHSGTAEFREVRLEALSPDVSLADTPVVATRSPFEKATIEDARWALAQAESAAAVAEKKLAFARVEHDALSARIAAERSKVDHASDPKSASLAIAAAKAERLSALAKADSELTAARHQLEAAKRTAKPNDEPGKKAVATAEQAVAAATKTFEAAKAAISKEDGAYTALGPSYPRQSTGRRLALARWIADKQNPRTARVAVNHLWLRHFGTALVPSVSNFGLNGKQPTHPELLDWLAIELSDNGWSMKRLHRLIVTSNAYRMSSAAGDDPANASKDRDNVYLWRMNSRRMEAEVVRDSVLSAAGQLDTTMGGPELDESLGQTSRRRSLYFRITPDNKMEMLELFDLANPNACYERIESVVPQQALALTNSALALDQSRRLGQKLNAQFGPASDVKSNAPFIQAAFETVLSRAPTEAERIACERFLKEHSTLLATSKPRDYFPAGPSASVPPATDPFDRARENLIHVLFSHNDFITIR